MKHHNYHTIQQRCLQAFGTMALATGLASSANAAVTGQWDFKGSLSATIGQDLIAVDSATSAGTVFGTTTSFGIATVGGTATNVMKFPAGVESYSGYWALVGASANDNGSFVNQYTVIMDVLYPATSSGKVRALFVTDNGDE